MIITGSHGYVGTELRKRVSGYYVDTEIGTDIMGKTYTGENVIHLAAVSGVESCQRDPLEAVRTNVYGTAVIADEAQRIIFTSTVGAATADNFYTQTKRSAENAIESISDDYVILRLSNLYGGSKDTVVNRFIRRAQQGMDLRVHSPGTQTRDFIHVSDAVDAIQRATKHDDVGKYIVASGQSYSIIEVAEIVCEHFDVDYEIVDNPRPGKVTSVSDLPSSGAKYDLPEYILSESDSKN